MADNEDIKQGLENLQEQISDQIEKSQDELFLEQVAYEESIEYLRKLWADFHLYIIKPYIAPSSEVSIILPKQEDTGNLCTIFDYGDLLSSSRADDMIIGDASTAKLMNTIEKMIRLSLKRILAQLEEDGDAGSSGSGEGAPVIEVAFRGHELAKRKAFEVFMGLQQRVDVINYEPVAWGERRLNGLEAQVEHGFEPNISALRY